MNRRRRWKAKHRRVDRKVQDHALVTDVEIIGMELRKWKDDPDPEKKVPPPIALRPPARLRARANRLVGRIYKRVFFSDSF